MRVAEVNEALQRSSEKARIIQDEGVDSRRHATSSESQDLYAQEAQQEMQQHHSAVESKDVRN